MYVNQRKTSFHLLKSPNLCSEIRSRIENIIDLIYLHLLSLIGDNATNRFSAKHKGIIHNQTLIYPLVKLPPRTSRCLSARLPNCLGYVEGTWITQVPMPVQFIIFIISFYCDKLTKLT